MTVMQSQDRPQGRGAVIPVSAPAPSFHLSRLLLLVQGGYFCLTGLWPLVSLRTFEMVTGPKADGWLVKTVGVLVSVIGGLLLFGAARQERSPVLPLLAVGSALGLAGIDLVYVARRRIAPIYLADALAELVLSAGWLAAWRREWMPEASYGGAGERRP